MLLLLQSALSLMILIMLALPMQCPSDVCWPLWFAWGQGITQILILEKYETLLRL